MLQLINLPHNEAEEYFLQGSSYFNGDMPSYIKFDPVLEQVRQVLQAESYRQFKKANPCDFKNVNYEIVTNKDGRLAWRPLELIHPAIYISIVNTICQPDNWNHIVNHFTSSQGGSVDCCGLPVISMDDPQGTSTQIQSWWKKVEQQSLRYSLEFSHVLHSDVVDCYGSLYTHSISWSLHGIEESKKKRNKNECLGNLIDSHIQASRYGQTNGISQGSVLMDFVAEIVLNFVDQNIDKQLGNRKDFKILRYRDDYRIFTNGADRAEEILKVISDELRRVGMKLGVSKTFMSKNVIEGSIKADKLAAIDLQDLGITNAKTIQKQLLRLHSFGQKFPNSGALRRLVSDLYKQLVGQSERPEDLEVQVAIATDIAFVSPNTFPMIAAILSHLISLASDEEKNDLWQKVVKKMKKLPYNGYLEIWMQRVTQPRAVGIKFDSSEKICKLVNGETLSLWNNEWVSSKDLKKALDSSQIIVGSAEDVTEAISPTEVILFQKNASSYS
jgi:RNA-directed DNA polymerase